ncbi:hypothetical protein V8C42DRAFT_307418 [Trichoderma barbatum]
MLFSVFHSFTHSRPSTAEYSPKAKDIKMRSTILITAFIASALADYSGTPQECAVKCTTAHNACLVKPDANRAQCASEYAACLGYNPYENGFVQPTACSSKTTAAPTQTKPPPPPPPPPHHDECKCYDEYNKCRGAPGANMSYCASQYAECLGYNPFDGHHDPEEIAKKCSKPIITPTPHNGTAPPVHPTNPPIISGGSGTKPLELFSYLAAAVAAFL